MGCQHSHEHIMVIKPTLPQNEFLLQNVMFVLNILTGSTVRATRLLVGGGITGDQPQDKR